MKKKTTKQKLRELATKWTEEQERIPEIKSSDVTEIAVTHGQRSYIMGKNYGKLKCVGDLLNLIGELGEDK